MCQYNGHFVYLAIFNYVIKITMRVCSIIGYKGESLAAPLLVTCLQKMEYRGYDSVGIGTISDGKVSVRKGVGRVEDVDSTLHLRILPGRIGIGHTRWATHGRVTEANAHPHTSCNGEIAVVHNGIIQNYSQLKSQLLSKGHVFKSETDSEVIAHLLEDDYTETGDLRGAISNTSKKLAGAFSFIAAFSDGTIAGARFDEPLIVGISKDGYYISSDVVGFLNYTDRAIFLDNRDIVILKGSGMEMITFDGAPVIRPVTQVAWEFGGIDKGTYAHFTIKEINEQVETIVKSGKGQERRIEEVSKMLKLAPFIYFTGSGTSYHCALVAKNLLAKYGKRKSDAIVSSEFQYLVNDIERDSVIVAISQSGETADVLEVVKKAKTLGSKIISIVNVPTSSLARLSDVSIHMNCGPEIGVAATKSFTSQLTILYAIVDSLSGGVIGLKDQKYKLQSAVKELVERQRLIEQIAEEIKDVKDIYVLGRSIHYPIALEGALKIKELSYVHAEGIPAGELKHGPLALIDRNSCILVLNPNDSTFEDIEANAHEIKARGASLIGIGNSPSDVYDRFITIPEMDEVFYPLLEVIPFQMIAYYLALEKDANPDYPRNLAKSVTVK
ncbi:MAG: glutamine--fructose-6-phosphate transaminase (isomerizing) [Nitrososphaeraceae archaeon]